MSHSINDLPFFALAFHLNQDSSTVLQHYRNMDLNFHKVVLQLCALHSVDRGGEPKGLILRNQPKNGFCTSDHVCVNTL